MYLKKRKKERKEKEGKITHRRIPPQATDPDTANASTDMIPKAYSFSSIWLVNCVYAFDRGVQQVKKGMSNVVAMS
jgi:hypothetical protein